MCRKDKNLPELTEFDRAARNRQLLASSFTVQSFPPLSEGTGFIQLVLGYDEGPNKCDQLVPADKEKPAAFFERAAAKIAETYNLFAARLASKNIPLLSFEDDGQRQGGVAHKIYFTPDQFQLIAQGKNAATLYTKTFPSGLTSQDTKVIAPLMRTLQSLADPADWIEFQAEGDVTVKVLKDTVSEVSAINDTTLQISLAGVTAETDRAYIFQTPKAREKALSISISCGLAEGAPKETPMPETRAPTLV